ncbi:hypothetical protein LO80_09550 [Candidatus Francisella endociliophora]|uniref:Uncharacterized protein n=1 Tax=Candidatus Francisella endociliophora TaxID=653937 RepID=A0A097ERI9_9GAMM|nr:hypothetical protein [Francisella sp. FSC1006]AIT10188.1 hypothetical protein LO80_09550 [Francisella sp. FSC1006]
MVILALGISVSLYASVNTVQNENGAQEQLKDISTLENQASSRKVILHSQTEYSLQNNIIEYNSGCLNLDASNLKYGPAPTYDIYKEYDFKLDRANCGMFVSQPYHVTFKFNDDTGYNGISIDLDSGKYRIASNHEGEDRFDGTLGKNKTDFLAKYKNGKTYIKQIVI